MKYLFLMTLSGSVLFLFYWCWTKLFPAFMTRSMKYKAVTVVLLVYVVPWVWLKGLYSHVTRWFLQVRAPEGSGLPVAIADIITEEEAYRTADYRWELWIAGVWFVVTLLLVTYKTLLYFGNKRKLLGMSEERTDEALKREVEHVREELHYNGRLNVYATPLDDSSFTLGLIRPIIFIQKDYADDRLYFVLKHEMTHIVRRDLLLKFLLEFTCCCHWFNPLIYWLNAKFDDACEESCDERAMESCTHEERLEYTRLLVDNYSGLQKRKRDRRKIPFESRLSSYKRIEERVNLIMEAREVKSWKKRIAGGVFAAAVVMNSFTAMAYPDVYHVEDDNANVAYATVFGGASWTDVNGNIDYGNAGAEHEQVVVDVIFDDEFIDEEGNVYPANSASPYVFCLKHDIREGYYQTHLKDDNGGCTVETYAGKRCTICNTIWIGDWVSTYKYAKCPH